MEGVAHLAPRVVERLRGEGIVELAAGINHVVGLSDAGDVWTWGIGLHGQLGHGNLDNQALPTLLTRLQEKVIIAVSAGHSHTMVISDEDMPYCWGFTHG
jgi:alpha-tubulin suppressor-like RCC1 family protein